MANPGAWQVDRDRVEDILRDYAALRGPSTDPELGAVCAAILLEDVFDVVLPDDKIDLRVLTDPPAVAALVARLRGAV
jgi:hypothetical protein